MSVTRISASLTIISAEWVSVSLPPRLSLDPDDLRTISTIDLGISYLFGVAIDMSTLSFAAPMARSKRTLLVSPTQAIFQPLSPSDSVEGRSGGDEGKFS